VNASGVPLLTNAAYTELFGERGERFVPRDERGQPLSPALLPQQRAARGESFRMEFTVTDDRGGQRWFEANGRPVRDAEGRQQWGVVVIRDITERSLRRLQEEFIANVSHDLRTPLTAAYAGLDMLSRRLARRLEPAERDILDNARRNAERLRRLIEDLLAVSQLEARGLTIERAPLDLRDVAREALSAVEEQVAAKGQTLTTDLPEPLPAAGDRRRLEQVMVNLLANANRHTPAGTRIAVEGRAAGDEVRLTVRDTGPGIPAQDLEAIFQRFRRLGAATGGRAGAGLGLAIARGLVELHGGRLWAESRPGEGTVFHLALPRMTDDE
jgi:two-component system CheB/CheR fusion protein